MSYDHGTYIAKKQHVFFDILELDRRKDIELICNTLKDNIWERWDGWWDGFGWVKISSSLPRMEQQSWLGERMDLWQGFLKSTPFTAVLITRKELEGCNHLELFSLNCIVLSVYQKPRSELGEIAAERIKHILITGHVFTVKRGRPKTVTTMCIPELCNPSLAQKSDLSLGDARCHILQKNWWSDNNERGQAANRVECGMPVQRFWSYGHHQKDKQVSV